MFNKRKRSYRKGPPANQIYVPHDQRQLNPNPIPIMTEKQAQFYYRQLKDMGYIPPQQTQDIQVFQIATADQSYKIKFKLDADETVTWYGSLPENLNLTDMNGQPIDPQYYGQIVDKLNQNGYKTYPFLLLNEPRIENHSTDQTVPVQGIYNSASTNFYTVNVQPGHYTSFSYIKTAKISHAYQYVYMIDADTDYQDSASHVGCARIGEIPLWHFTVNALVLVSVKTK